MDPQLNRSSASFPVFPLLFLTSIFFLNFQGRIVFGPLLPLMVEDFNMGPSGAGSLFFYISLGYAVGLLGSGFISSRLNHRRTIVLSSLAVGISLIAVSLSTSFAATIVWLVVMGMAAGPYLPSGVATITTLAPPRTWGTAFAIHELAPNLGLIAAPLVVEAIILLAPWRVVPLVLAATVLAIGLAYYRFGKGGDFPGQPLAFSTVRTLAREPSFWLMILLFGLGVGASLGVYIMMPLYLIAERDMDRSLVNQYLALSRIASLVLAFAGGWVSDRLGPKTALSGVFLLTGVLTLLLGLVPGRWVLLFLFLQPMLAVCFFPAGFSALSRIGPREGRSLTVSLTVPMGFILGAGVIPTAIGFAGETVGFSAGIAMTGVLLLLGPVVVRRLALEPAEQERI